MVAVLRSCAGLLLVIGTYWLLGVGGCSVKPPIAPEQETLRRITQDAYPKRSLCWSPDGGKLVYTCRKAANYGLFVVDFTSMGITELASGAGYYASPDWSPDGTSVAATYTVGGRSSIRNVDYPGGNANDIYFMSCPVIDAQCELYPTWSFLGDQLAVLVDAYCYGLYGQIYTVTLGEFGCTGRLTSGASEGNGGLNWANTGDRIAYWYRADPTPWTRVRILSIETGIAYDLAPGTTYDRSPDWSPDDKYICFVSERGGTVDIWAALSDNSAPPERITNDADVETCPRWSPDGKRIAFISDHGGQEDIWTIPVPASAVE